MSRRLVPALAGCAGFVAGALLVFSLGDRSDGPIAAPPAETPSVTDTVASTPTDPVSAETAPVTGAEPEVVAGDTLLMWTSGALAPGFADGVTALDETQGVSVVRGGDLELVRVASPSGVEVERHENGWHVPIDTIVVDVASHRDFVASASASVLDLLGPGQALLSETGARLRGGGVGLVLMFATGSVEVVGVIDDASASGAELVVDVETGRALGLDRERFLLVSHGGDRQALQDGAVEVLDGLGVAAPIRFRSRAETTWLRHGDAVLPSGQIKLHFGEFAVRDGDGRTVEVDPAWIEANIVETAVPILGSVRCHRAAIAPLEAALGELVDRALPHVIDVEQYAGCFVPRRIGEGLPLSRHAWGIAVDLNVGDNPRGSFATQDPRLVDAMRTAGFGWGGSWLVPDPAHYEIIETGRQLSSAGAG